MSRLKNVKIGAYIPHVDDRLKNYISFTTTCDIPKELRDMFSIAITKIADQMEEDGLLIEPERIPEVTCIATDFDIITIELDKEQLGIITHIIVYPVHKWTGYNEKAIYTFIIEEFCHMLWNIKSEYKVNFKVLDVIKRIYPNVKMEDIYSLANMAEEAKREE